MMAHFLMQAIAGAARRRASGGGGDGRLITDRLEYVDDAAAALGGWESSSTAPTWGYATSPAPLPGAARSLLVTASSQSAAINFSAQPELWIYFSGNTSNTSVNTLKLLLRDAGGVELASMRIAVNGAWRVTAGGGAVGLSSSGLITAGVTNNIWLHYTAGTGTNARMELYASPDGSRSDVITLVGNGTSTGSAARLVLSTDNSAAVIFNNLIVSSSEIGDDPSF